MLTHPMGIRPMDLTDVSASVPLISFHPRAIIFCTMILRAKIIIDLGTLYNEREGRRDRAMYGSVDLEVMK